jgi:hypothetical protein
MKPPNIVIKQETEKTKPISSSLSPSGIYITQSCFQMSSSVNIEVNIDQGRYSETGVHIVMEHNFVCVWRRHHCS